jgi:hypothetical protein
MGIQLTASLKRKTALLEKLTVAWVVKKLPAFHGARRFAIAYTRNRNWAQVKVKKKIHTHQARDRITQLVQLQLTFKGPLVIISMFSATCCNTKILHPSTQRA